MTRQAEEEEVSSGTVSEEGIDEDILESVRASEEILDEALVSEKSEDAGAQPSRKTYKATKPNMGGLCKGEYGDWIAWVGGKPDKDWKGLEEPKPRNIQTGQKRSPRLSDQHKGEYRRRTGLEPCFKREDDLQMFQRQVIDHFEECGLDTITYLPDPGDTSKMISVVTDHGRFNTKKAVQQANALCEKEFDSYDHNNQLDAQKFLYNSLSVDLKKQLMETTSKTDCFAAIWMELMGIINSVSISRFDSIKKRFKERSIASYSGENVEAISSDYLADYEDLHSAGMYDHNFTRNMLTAIMKAGGNSEDFRSRLRATQDKLESHISETRYLGYQARHEHMVKEELDVQSILNLAKAKYCVLLRLKTGLACSTAKPNSETTQTPVLVCMKISHKLSKRTKSTQNMSTNNNTTPSIDNETNMEDSHIQTTIQVLLSRLGMMRLK